MANKKINRIDINWRALLKLEWVYCFFAFGFGLIFIALLAPGWSPDEPQHYWRAQQVAHGDLMPNEFKDEKNNVYSGGQLLPDENRFILSYQGFEGLTDHSLRLNFPMWENEGAIAQRAAQVNTVAVAFPGSARYSPVVYAPQAVGLFIANVLALPLLAGFILAKLFGLIVQVAAFAAAIRITPKGKWIFFTIGLLPSTVVQSAALGGDVMTTSVSVLFIATVIKLAFDTKKIVWWHIGLIAVFIALLGLVKPAYLPLAAIAILIPIFNKSFRKKSKIAISSAVLVLAALPGMLWLKATSFIQDNYSHGVDPSAQQQYVLHEPLNFIATLFNTYFTDAQPKLYKTLFGNFVWDTAPIPFIFMLLCAVVMVITLFVSSPREKKITFPVYVKVLFLAISGLLVTAISYGLYVYYTAFKDTSILGLQGRYFIPFLPLVGLAFLNPGPQKQQKWIKVAVVLSLVALLVSAVVVLIFRIYK